ncbi:sensor histidine kinase [Amphritea balenae]|uniref:histidine kinase n=1 Tax=Amphritea balenae TaxID=452629 RepID=A0A3P1SQQ3_9GAMM|nr:HAMP domain-containing sensor histidine kinase [Amphritea balenae]RRC98975.1 sensor histidine kinase [Amphritea balenae]GGK63341.1 hypothetical protein GCM10007941_11860 [Amphritea balenae]
MAIRWYKRIFCKIFLIVWLTSFLVIAGTAFIVGSMSEKERYQEVLTAKVLGQAELIVDRYERTGRLPPKPRREFRWNHDHDDDWDDDRDDWDDDRRRGHDRDKRSKDRDLFPLKMQIFDLQKGLVIFGIQDETKFRSPRVLKLQSFNNKMYRVVVEMDFRRSFAAKVIGFVVSVQVVLMLFVATLTALLISWIIVRPINRLRQHTRDLYNGDLSARTDGCLNQRGDEIGELSREFNRMADYVEQTLQSNQHLLQDVSHELRGPLARLQMAAGLAGQRVAEEDWEYIERINLECDRINKLIDEILSLSRLEQMEASDQRFDAAKVIETLVEDYRFSAPEHQLTVDTTNCFIKGNSALLERALNNILGNAVKHTPAGSQVALSVGSEGGDAVIRVKDNGPGLTPEQLESLFKPFTRFTEQNNGYGLGLSIALRAVQLLGGSLEARSEPGAGLELVMKFPARA